MLTTVKPIKTVLLIEDNPGDVRLLRELLKDEGPAEIKVTHVATMCEAETFLAEHAVDIILLDLGLPDANGLGAVKRVLAAAPRIPLVVLTGSDDASLAAQALHEGAEDYLIKGQIVSSSSQSETRVLVRALSYAVERKAMDEQLFSERERAEVTLNSIGDAVACTDSAGNLTFLNRVAEKLTGWSWAEAEGRPMTEVLRILHGATGASIANPMELAIGCDRTVHLPANCVILRRDGSRLPIEESVAPIHDSQGRSAGTVIVLRDVSAARDMQRQITHSAEHDFLTGLPNRMLLNDRIDQAILLAPRHGQQVAVLFLDLDGFKHINDFLGHSAGDKLLQSVAGSIVRCVRSSDTVSRQGGDEFVILLSEAQQGEDAAIVAKRILEAVARPHTVDQRDLHVTASIGVSIFPDDGADAETLIKNADTAMYQAKENGRQGFRFFKPIMNVRAVDRRAIEEALRRALERNEFKLHYQPKIDLKTGAITGAEALIRWTTLTRGVVPPSEFIPVAEASGLILPIGAWVLREACVQAKKWLDAGMPRLTMAVNVSAMEFLAENYLDGVLRVLDETGLDPKLLELELTESVLMARADPTALILQTLRERGVQVAIDDFGTGYSSLSYLRNCPVDTLKIDQSFVRQISKETDDATIVTAVIAMARSLKLRVVAEGVETLEELTFLCEHHCDEAQGYYFSRPVPPNEFASLLRTGITVPLPGAKVPAKIRMVSMV